MKYVGFYPRYSHEGPTNGEAFIVMLRLFKALSIVFDTHIGVCFRLHASRRFYL